MPSAPTLETAFERRADGASAAERPLVGVFGAGTPDLLITAHHAQVVDVKAPPLSDATDGPRSSIVDAVTEPFMDAFAQRFLHRFAAGAFDAFALLVFDRDDVAGLTAYQYASELRRLGHVRQDGPRLHLWNMIHSAARTASAYNLKEYARLETCLRTTLGRAGQPSDLATALASETDRKVALARWPEGSREAFVARAAGRWLSPQAHAALLDAAEPTAKPEDAPRIALVGTACDVPVMYDLCSGLGTIVADLQDYARCPGLPASADPTALLAALADDPLHIRAMPPGRYTSALHEHTREAELVVAATSPNDDSFGWETPGLRAATEARGARFLDLGFRPFRPTPDWCAAARDRIAEALA